MRIKSFQENLLQSGLLVHIGTHKIFFNYDSSVCFLHFKKFQSLLDELKWTKSPSVYKRLREWDLRGFTINELDNSESADLKNVNKPKFLMKTVKNLQKKITF